MIAFESRVEMCVDEWALNGMIKMKEKPGVGRDTGPDLVIPPFQDEEIGAPAQQGDVVCPKLRLLRYSVSTGTHMSSLANIVKHLTLY